MNSSEWREMRLGDFVSLQRGYDLPESKRTPGEIPVFGSFGVTGYHDTARAKGPGVTIGRSGASFGVVNYSPVDYWPHNTALFVTDFHGNAERFAYYFLSAIDFQKYNSGSAQPSLNRNFIYSIPIRVPPPAEQRSIASILGTLDDKIELNRRTNETLKEMARALFKSWFVDFDPVRAKMEGRRPAGMDDETAALFPDRFEDSELGEIPKGWPLTSLNKVLTAKNDRVGESDVPEYSSTNEGLQLRSERFKKKLSESTSKNKLIRQGDLVFGLSRQVLNFGLMRESVGCVSPAYKVFAIDQSAVVPDLLERTMRMRSSYFYTAISASSREGQSVSTHGLGLLKFVRPEPVVQNMFYLLTEPLRTLAKSLQSETHTLTAIRDALLPKLMSGEIRVGEAAQMLEQVL